MSNSGSNSHEASHYVVTAHPPGAVLLAAKCNFLAPQSLVSADVCVTIICWSHSYRAWCDSVDRTCLECDVVMLCVSGRTRNFREN
jgi:hypothetical protein